MKLRLLTRFFFEASRSAIGDRILVHCKEKIVEISVSKTIQLLGCATRQGVLFEDMCSLRVYFLANFSCM